jgi:ferritin
MISKKMTDELNEQIREELYSAYLYTSMSSYATYIGLDGVAKWFFIQAQEETTHALRFYNYINSQGQQVVLKAIDQPPATFESAQEMFAAALRHEQHITGRINVLANLAVEEKDHATEIFLQWFVSEQVEEEESANRVLSQLKLAGEGGGGLFMIDRELGQRVFTMPADLTLP